MKNPSEIIRSARAYLLSVDDGTPSEETPDVGWDLAEIAKCMENPTDAMAEALWDADPRLKVAGYEGTKHALKAAIAAMLEAK